MLRTLCAFLACSLLACSLALVPGLSAGDHLTFAYDPQRTGWAADERLLSRANVGQLQLQWKVELKNTPKEMTALTAPIVVTGVATPQGVKNVAYVVGSSDTVFALDADTGEQVWTQAMRVFATSAGRTHWLCPQGVNATPVADKKDNTLYTISSDGKLHRFDLGTGEAKGRPMQFVPPFSKNWSLNLVDNVLYTTISQGCGGARSGIYAFDMRDPLQPVVRFLFTSKAGGAGVWGRAGAAIGENGLVYVAAGDGPFNPATHEFGSSVVAGRLGDLKLADYFTPPNWKELNELDLDLGSASPVWFRHQNWELVAVGAKEGVVYLMDARSLGGKDHQAALYTSPLLSNDGQSFEGHGIWGSFSTWRDDSGRRWLYVPTWGPVSKKAPKFPITNGQNPHGSVMAFKVVTDPKTKKPSLEPAWISGNFAVPEPVVIANGVVFALSNGENVRQTEQGGKIVWMGLKIFNTEQRSVDVRPGVLFALDAQTGKELWSSGDAIQKWVHFSGPVVANGRVYAVDHGSRVYCFGLKK